MCGIVGILHKSDQPINRTVLEKMTRSLVHRGPDDEGFFFDGPVGFGFRRLSVIDLAHGHQPMTTPDGRYTIVFNGEIYNFPTLKENLEKEGVVFSTRSDTEVLLWLYARKGKDCLKSLNGMFSFAIWDSHDKKIFAARDRMGEKPFYYWDTNDHFAFASECKALLAHPRFSKTLDPQALRYFFQFEYVPAPLSIFRGIKKLPQAHYLVVDQQGVKIEKYWDIPFFSPSPPPSPQREREIECESENDVAKKIVSLLDQSVERRLISDVPLGVFLSGGIDSSAVVALMARHRLSQQIKTFSIGFEEKSYDESDEAQRVARLFGTDHYTERLTPEKMQATLPEIAKILDEPFADYSIVPTYLLSKFTRKTVTVALGGDGGDELFAGYPTFLAGRLADIYRRFPSVFKKIIGSAISCLPVSLKDLSLDFKLKQFLYGANFPPVLRNQVWLGAFHAGEMKKLFCRGDPCDRPQSGRIQDSPLRNYNPLDLIEQTMSQCPSQNSGDRMLYFYQKFYLADDILFKTDRASMAASLEVRAPFLDVDLVEYVSRLPYSFKQRGLKTKWILKRALSQILPPDIIHRRKKGFGIPTALWFRGPLRPMLEECLSRKNLEKEGLFNADYVQKLMAEHQQGQKNNRKQLFSLLMFELWRKEFLA